MAYHLLKKTTTTADFRKKHFFVVKQLANQSKINEFFSTNKHFEDLRLTVSGRFPELIYLNQKVEKSTVQGSRVPP